MPLPAGVTARKLRHTFASILAALGEPMPYVMQQLGHTDPAFTLRVYGHQMRRGDDEKARLVALVERAEWAPLGTSAVDGGEQGGGEEAPETTEPPRLQGLQVTRPAGFEPATSRSGGERSIH